MGKQFAALLFLAIALVLIVPPCHAADRRWEDEVAYVIIPEKFCNGDKTNDVMARKFGAHRSQYQGGYWGGDLQGVIQKLDYLSGLGITSLLIYPVVQNDEEPAPFSHFLAGGYRPKDYFSVDENLGTMPILQDLVQKCHDRGIRVILDLPLALPGFENPLFNDQQKKAAGWFGKTSGYGVPAWNVDNPEVADYLIKVSKFWRDQTHCDGFRIDSAVLLSRSFWKRYTREIKAGAPKDFLIMGEIVLPPRQIGDFLRETGFDSAYDFSFLTAQSVFGQGSDIGQLSFIQNEAAKSYPDSRIMFGELDNYEDKEFIREAQEPRQKRMELALDFLFTANRIPLLYSGDEAALSYRDTGALFDPANANPDFTAYLKRLTILRRQHSSLRRGDYQELPLRNPIYSFVRTDGMDRVLVVLNNSRAALSVAPSLPGTPWGNASLFDLLQQKVVKASGESTPLTVPGFGAAILQVR